MHTFWAKLDPIPLLERRILSTEIASVPVTEAENGTTFIVSGLSGISIDREVCALSPKCYPAESLLPFPRGNKAAMACVHNYEQDLVGRFPGRRIRIFWRPVLPEYCFVSYVIG